jgi:molybdopterin molybdotransferase
MGELFQARTVAEARELLARHLGAGQPAGEVDLLAGLGRRLVRDVIAGEDVPGFDRSTMDGFAARARDTFGASEGLPAYLDVTGEIFMGRDAGGGPAAHEVWRIPTGGVLPPGTDAVVMVEYTEELDRRTIGITRPVAPGDNIVRRGEDVAAGDVALEAGHILRAQDLGLLAAVGVTRVAVAERPKVAIISTGDEVVPPAQKPGPGQVRDINSYALYGQVLAAGGEPRLYGIARDEFAALQDQVQRALQECGLVLISGGSSVGARDVAVRVMDSLGRPGVLFHGISIKPGKPTIGAVVNGQPVFGLPGHPVSAMVVFDLLVAPLVRDGGYRNDHLEFPVRAAITRTLRSAAGREDYIRVRLLPGDTGLLADPVLGKSGLIGTMTRARGLAYIPAEKEGVEAGEQVAVKLF